MNTIEENVRELWRVEPRLEFPGNKQTQVERVKRIERRGRQLKKNAFVSVRPG